MSKYPIRPLQARLGEARGVRLRTSQKPLERPERTGGLHLVGTGPIQEQKCPIRVMTRVATNSTNARNAEQDFRESALQHLDRLYSYAMALVRNQAEAEDLVQETYLRAIQAFERLRPNSNLKSWLFTILRNIRLNQVRGGLTK
jgi:hypothetical protein